MRAPVEFGNAAVNTSLPVGWGQLAQKLIVRVDERNAAMRAIQIARLDGPRAAEVVEIAEPSGDGEVIIDVHAAGVAFPDALQSRGLYQYKPEMPYTPGGRSPRAIGSVD
jgi:NADPH2:quinone reductase